MHYSTKRWLTLVVVCLAVVLLGWVVASAELSSRAAPVPKFEPFSQSAQASDDVSQSEPASGDDRGRLINDDNVGSGFAQTLTILAYVIIAAAVLALLGYVGYRLFTTRPSGWDRVEDRAATQPDAEVLRGALHAGVSDIDSGGDPRKAVIACWLRLERAAAEAGVPRFESETPDELIARVLASYQVDDRALGELAEVYHRARYAPRDVASAERETARAALVAVDAQLSTHAGQGSS